MRYRHHIASLKKSNRYDELINIKYDKMKLVNVNDSTGIAHG